MNLSWLIKTESYKKGMLLSVVFNVISKGILFVLTILIARFFGSDIKTDIYFFVYGSMVLFSGFINTIDTVVLVPASMRLREATGDEGAMAFLNYFFRVYVVVGVLFVALMFFFGTTIFGLLSKFPETDILRYKAYFLLGSFYFLFMVLTNYINAILSSLKFFTIPMIISGINSCIVIAGILLLHGRFDVLGIFWGGIAAYSINLALLLVAMKQKTHWNFFTKAPLPGRKVWRNIFYAELGQLATLASSLFPLYLLSGFGSGAVSMMSYGKNIADIPNTLITAQLTNVNGIELNEQAARQDHGGMNASFVQTGKLLLFILIPVGCFLFVFARPVVELFYQRGNFNREAVEGAAKFLQLLSVTIFCIGINAAVTRVFIAMQAIRVAFLYQLVMNVLLIAAIWIFTRYYGVYGYPYGVILLNAMSFLLMFLICKKLVPHIRYGALLQYAGIIFLVNIPIAAGLYFIVPFLRTGALLTLFISFMVYCMVLLLLNRALHLCPELDLFKKSRKGL